MPDAAVITALVSMKVCIQRAQPACLGCTRAHNHKHPRQRNDVLRTLSLTHSTLGVHNNQPRALPRP